MRFFRLELRKNKKIELFRDSRKSGKALSIGSARCPYGTLHEKGFMQRAVGSYSAALRR
jgi:hypothetical protein